MVQEELERFEKAFNCKGFLEGRTSGIATIFARIFYQAMYYKGYGCFRIGNAVHKTYVNIRHHIKFVTPIEKMIAKEFAENENYEYKGILGDYND